MQNPRISSVPFSTETQTCTEVATQSAVGELSEAAGLSTSLQKATKQFPKIYNYIRALATPQKGQRRLGSVTVLPGPAGGPSHESSALGAARPGSGPGAAATGPPASSESVGWAASGRA